MLGQERARLVRGRFGLFVSGEDRPAFNDFLELVFQGRGQESCEVTIRSEQPPGSRHRGDRCALKGRELFARIEGIVSEDGKACRVLVADITESKRAEVALEESEERFRTLADSSPDGIFRFNREFRLLYANPLGAYWLGLEGPLEFPGVEYDLPAVFIPGWEAPAREVFETGHLRRFETSIERRGQAWTYEVIVAPELGSDGLVHSVISTARDITERRRTEEERRQHAEGLELLSSNATRMLGNLSTPELYQIVADQIHAVAGGAAVAFSEFDPQSHTLVVREFRCTSEQRERLVRLLGRNPEGIALDFPEEIQAHLLPDGFGHVEDGLHALSIGSLPAALIDRIEEELKISDVFAMSCRAESELLGTVAILTHEHGPVLNKKLIESVVNQAALAIKRKRVEEALQEADRYKDHFLAVLSHELRNPLAPIKNSLYLLGRAPPGSERANRARAVIDRQVGHLVRLVDDLLDVNRISRNKIYLKVELLEIGEVVQKTAEDYREILERDGIEFELHLPAEPIWIRADRTRIAQVLGNLLSNAVKFTARNSLVALGLEREGQTALLRVRDTGLGIPAEVLGQLFQPFMQAHQNLDRGRLGLGLGLALVKGLVELHGGTVSATSEGPGRGAEFTVRLPVTEGGEQTTAQPATDSQAKRRSILIIEDNADAAESLKEVLELFGHEVRVAYDGPAGITAAAEAHPDVVLCDIGLPGMDGYQVAEALRADDRLRRIALIALSGYTQPEDVSRARRAGFDAHLAKPPSIEKIEELLARMTA